MSAPSDGGPAFPVPAVYDASRSEVNSSSAYTGECGMSLRDYFIAHAPAEPPHWFRPTMPTARPELPKFPETPLADHAERSYVREFQDVIALTEIKNPDLREFVEAKQRARLAISEWTAEAERQRSFQWPIAWADAMLKARVA